MSQIAICDQSLTCNRCSATWRTSERITPLLKKRSRVAPSMTSLRYIWKAGDRGHTLDLVYVEGTNGHPYSFGDVTDSRPMELQGFFIGTVPVTQALWTHVMGFDKNPAMNRGEDLPLENVSWDEIT
jgi:hypothetical protein